MESNQSFNGVLHAPHIDRGTDMKRRLIGCVALAVAFAARSASAADIPGGAPVYTPAPPPAWLWDFGARYWYSSAKNGYNYYGDTTTSLLVSRLTYQGMTANSGEAYFRLDGSSGPLTGVFLKGYAGGGVIFSGNLIDEDFPPVTVPYSNTTSNLTGSLAYASIDLGYSLFDNSWARAVRAGDVSGAMRLGAFVGYHYWQETANAYGCTQNAGNPICAPPFTVPTSVLGVTEQDKWNSLRLGVTGDVLLSPRFRLTGEFAYVWTSQSALDTHYLTWGPDPATGNGTGFQTEAVLSYQLTDYFHIGIGGRWWHFNTNAVDSFGQLETYTTDRYGGFLQAGLQW
jgi:hypothetical protein